MTDYPMIMACMLVWSHGFVTAWAIWQWREGRRNRLPFT